MNTREIYMCDSDLELYIPEFGFSVQIKQKVLYSDVKLTKSRWSELNQMREKFRRFQRPNLKSVTTCERRKLVLRRGLSVVMLSSLWHSLSHSGVGH